MPKAYPLSWPPGRGRTPAAERGRGVRFKVSFATAYGDLLGALRGLGAVGVVVSTEVPLRRDGRPYFDDDGRPASDDPGVAVWFQLGESEYVFACDCWNSVRCNTRAVGLAVEGLRAIQRTGSAQLVAGALAGFAALPAEAGQGRRERPWREVLGLEGLSGPTFAIRAAIEYAYKKLVAELHPDRPGAEPDALLEVNLARDAAMRELDDAEAAPLLDQRPPPGP